MMRLPALALLLPSAAAAQPANGGLANVTPVAEPGTVTGTNVGATLDAGEPAPSCHRASA